jgi:hypothetical protein
MTAQTADPREGRLVTALLERTSLAELAQQQVRTLDVMWDLDGCAIWFDRQYVTGCQRLGIIPPGEHPPAQHWQFFENHGHTFEEFRDNCDRLADLGLLWMGPVIAGAKTAWDTIIDAGHRIHVKTDRAFGSSPAASEVGTHIWLNVEGLTHHSVTFGKDKTAGEPCDVALEDRLDNYDDLERVGTRAYLIDRPWNQPALGDLNLRTGLPRRRIKTHDEFTEAVLLMGATEPGQDTGPW